MAGGTVTLTCSVTLPHGVTGTPDFQWEGPGGVTLTPAASMTSGQTVSNDLPLSDITTSQAGQYSCTATLGGYAYHVSSNMTIQSKNVLCILYVKYLTHVLCSSKPHAIH